MNIRQVIKKTFESKQAKGWDLLYVLLDVHGVILPSSWHKVNEFKFVTEDCIEVLQWFSKRNDFRIILWTSSYPTETNPLVKWLAEFEINIDYVNGNPNEPNNTYADFSFKPYYNILLDDKAGFEPTDWKAIKEELISIGEWDKNPVVVAQ
jgi:hypothetical protein